jgi:hypothetical protein
LLYEEEECDDTEELRRLFIEGAVVGYSSELDLWGYGEWSAPESYGAGARKNMQFAVDAITELARHLQDTWSDVRRECCLTDVTSSV